jgi:hypothetical protein
MMIWTGDQLDAARRLQQGVIEPGTALAAQGVDVVSWLGVPRQW